MRWFEIRIYSGCLISLINRTVGLSWFSSPLRGYPPDAVVVKFIVVRIFFVPFDSPVLLFDPVLVFQASLLVLLAMNLIIKSILSAT